MKRSHGAHSKGSRNLKTKGRVSALARLREFETGARVRIDLNPVYLEGRQPLRFNGCVGVVAGKQGSSYKVVLKDGGKAKTFFIPNVHLRPAA